MGEEKTVIQCHVVCRDISGAGFARWHDIVANVGGFWHEHLDTIEALFPIAYPQLEPISVKMMDLRTRQVYEHQWIELPDKETPFGFPGGFAIPLSELMKRGAEEEMTNGGHGNYV
jgi:hypothetical protein